VSPAAAGAAVGAARCPRRDEDINVAGRCRGPAEEQEKVMRTLGYVTAITMAAAGTALGVVAVRSLPEVRRYIAMRTM
jgi:hypothetical protein